MTDKMYYFKCLFFWRYFFMNILNSFKQLSKFEWILWIFSLTISGTMCFLSANFSILTLIASLVGVTGLIFVAKGDVLGQILTVVFSITYALISLKCRYFGEAITYIGMTMPIAIMSVISWIRNPYKKGVAEVKVEKLSKKKIVLMIVLSIVVTCIFYYILKFFNTNNLTFSTISITTSFLASYLMLNRSPLYAIAYACNDIILIVLWILPMIINFSIFFINDIYGLYSWSKMMKRQEESNY